MLIFADEWIEASQDRIEGAVAGNAVDGPPMAWFDPTPDSDKRVIYQTVCMGCAQAGDVSMLIEVVTHGLVNTIMAIAAPSHVPPLRLWWRARPALIQPTMEPYRQIGAYGYRMRLALTDLAGTQYKLDSFDLVKDEGVEMAMLDPQRVAEAWVNEVTA